MKYYILNQSQFNITIMGKKLHLMLIGITLIIMLPSCMFVRGIFLESIEVSTLKRSAVLRKSGFTLTKATEIRKVQNPPITGGRISAINGISSESVIIALKSFTTAIDNLYRVRIGKLVNNRQSLYIKENGSNTEVARVLGLSNEGNTVFQFYFEGSPISQPIELPGRIYKVSKNKVRLYTGKGIHYRVYKFELETDTPVLVLEEIKDGWTYVQYGNSRGYVKASDIEIFPILPFDEDKNMELYKPDLNGSGEICFTNSTKSPVILVFAQTVPDDIAEFGMADGPHPVIVIYPQETYTFFNLPVSLRYAYHVYRVDEESIPNLSEIALLYNKYFDKGEIKAEKNHCIFYNIMDENSISSDLIAGIFDNNKYRKFLTLDNKGRVGFKNNTEKNISVFLANSGESENDISLADKSNFEGPEIIIKPGEIKYFYWIKSNALYNYSVYYQDEDFSRYSVLSGTNNMISSSNIHLFNNEDYFKVIGAPTIKSELDKGNKKNRIIFENKSANTVAVFLCQDQIDACGASNFSSQFMILKKNEKNSFDALTENEYSYIVYKWLEGAKREDPFLENYRLLEGSFSSLIQNPQIVVIR